MKPLHHVTHLLGLAIAVGLLAACGPTATAVPPTSALTAVPATTTAVPPTPAPTLAPPTATASPPIAEPGPDLLAQVTAFEAAFDQQDTDGLLALFVADLHWMLLLGPGTGHYSAASPLAVRNTLEFQFEANIKLDATGCTTKTDQVSCVLVIKDDCTPPAVDAYHFHTQFTFTDGKLSNVTGRWDSSDERAFLAYDAARLAWARENLPEEAALYSSGPFEEGAAPGEWSKLIGDGEQGTGTLTAFEFGQLVERICTGYTAASQ